MARDGTASGGRPKGSPNRKTLEAISIFDELGIDPLRGLAEIADGKPFPDGTPPTTDQILTARKEAAQYIYPKRKAVEHSGSIGTHEETLEALAASADDAE